jgi:hypothetical protein
MPKRYEDQELVAHIEAVAPTVSEWPVAITAPGHDGFMIMTTERYHRWMSALPDPRRVVGLSEMSREDSEEILAAVGDLPQGPTGR